MAYQSVIPVLSINTDKLTKKEDQLAYLIRHAFYNPGWTSSQIEGALVSMRRLLAYYEYDRNEFANGLKQKLEQAVKHLYADHSVTVDTTMLSPNTYSVSISITNAQGQPVLSSTNIKVVDNNIILQFDRER